MFVKIFGGDFVVFGITYYDYFITMISVYYHIFLIWIKYFNMKIKSLDSNNKLCDINVLQFCFLAQDFSRCRPTDSTHRHRCRRSAFGLHFKCLRPQLLYWLFDCPEKRWRWWWRRWWPKVWGKEAGWWPMAGLCNQGGESMDSNSFTLLALAPSSFGPFVAHFISALTFNSI